MVDTPIPAIVAAGTLTGSEQIEVAQKSPTIKITAATISAQASDNSYNDSANGFAAAGFAVDDYVIVEGFTGNTVNNINIGKVGTLTTGKMTILSPEGDVIVDDAAGESVTITKWVSGRAPLKNVGAVSGTSFPSAPSTGDRIYRTDRNIEYFYDGTRWLSTTLYTLNFPTTNTAGFTADSVQSRSAVPFKGTYSLWLENWQTDAFITSTASWDLNLQYSDAANAQTTIATVNTTGYSANTHTSGQVAINAQLSSNALSLEFRPDEISGTSTLSTFGFLTYRLIG